MKDLLSRWFGPDPDELNAYRSVIPDSIRINQAVEDGVIVIRVTSINGEELPENTLLITEAKKKSDVVAKVNDLIMTHYDVPDNLRRYYEKTFQLEGHLNKNAVLVKG